ncbi:MAG: hypothetical protein ACYDC3_20560 [Candidatus Binataceae bacterium]
MKKTSKQKPTTDAVEIIHRRYYRGRPQRMAGLAEAEANDTVARKIYAIRNIIRKCCFPAEVQKFLLVVL